jgi:hypothetical protein
MSAKTLLMALGVGVVVGLVLGILLVGLIGGNREQALRPGLGDPPRRHPRLRGEGAHALPAHTAFLGAADALSSEPTYVLVPEMQ